jgi:hypothetical protein
MIGNFVQAVIRNSADDDARVGSGREVDIIDADSEASDDAAPGELRDHSCGHFGVGGEHRVGVARHFHNALGRGGGPQQPVREHFFAGSRFGKTESVTATSLVIMYPAASRNRSSPALDPPL